MKRKCLEEVVSVSNFEPELLSLRSKKVIMFDIEGGSGHNPTDALTRLKNKTRTTIQPSKTMRIKVKLHVHSQFQ